MWMQNYSPSQRSLHPEPEGYVIMIYPHSTPPHKLGKILREIHSSETIKELSGMDKSISGKKVHVGTGSISKSRSEVRV